MYFVCDPKRYLENEGMDAPVRNILIFQNKECAFQIMYQTAYRRLDSEYHSSLFYAFVYLFPVLGIQDRGQHGLGKHCITELYPQLSEVLERSLWKLLVLRILFHHPQKNCINYFSFLNCIIKLLVAYSLTIWSYFASRSCSNFGISPTFKKRSLLSVCVCFKDQSC